MTDVRDEVDVSVTALSGKMVTFRVPSGSTIWHVKELICELFGVSKFCQRLVADGQVILDDAILVTPVAFTLVTLSYVSDADGSSDLFLAAASGDRSSAESLLRAPVSPEQSSGSASPLLVAATYGHSEVVSLLCEAGACKDDVAFNGATPLFMAAQAGHLEVARALCDAGASVDRANADGATPTFVA